MLTLSVLAIWLFVVTHVDTLVVLVAFCADETYRKREVFVGHYLGFGIGLGAAIFISLLAAEFLREWTFLLGVVPIGLGLWELFGRRSVEPSVDDDIAGPVGRIAVVAAAGVGLSGENIAIFVPFFATLSVGELLAVVAIYVLGASVVFVVSLLLARWAVGVGLPTWLEERFVPLMLILVGGYVLSAGIVVF